MNRPLAFRVFWQGKMYPVLSLNPGTQTVWLSRYQVTGHPGDDILVSYAESPNPDDLPAKLMQFTGLVDAKGRDIYEGDIVEAKLYRSTSRFAVEWKSVANHSSFGAGTHNLTVIGNVHEHPELLTA